jgi:hypothetical protein
MKIEGCARDDAGTAKRPDRAGWVFRAALTWIPRPQMPSGSSYAASPTSGHQVLMCSPCPGTNRVQNRITQHQPTSTNINRRLAGERQFRPPKPWLAFLLATLATQHGLTTKCPRRAGRPPGWPGPRIAAAGTGWAGCGHPAGLPQGLPHDSPGAEPHDARTGSVEGCPWAAAWSGCARPTRCHTSPNVQDL